MDDHYIDIGDGDTFTLAPDPAPMVPQHLLKPSSGRYLSPMERATIMVADRQGQSVWSIAAMLGRAPSTISRELRRKRRHWMPRYHAWQPQLWAESRTIRSRGSWSRTSGYWTLCGRSVSSTSMRRPSRPTPSVRPCPSERNGWPPCNSRNRDVFGTSRQETPLIPLMVV